VRDHDRGFIELRFTVVGHSCLFLETRAGSILVDPWLSGSCYWRTWWHYPPTAEPTESMLAPDLVYLTHHHFDHFHYPSMRRLDPSTNVLVPRFGVDVMAPEVRKLGFQHVRELPSGKVVDLGDGVRLASYQYGFDDTAFVVAEDDHVIVDLNDCKIRGRALRRVMREFGRPTFVLKSWSFAQSYPIAYDAEDPADLTLVSRQQYLDDWVGRVHDLEPRYAVPFGSMMALLHPDARDLNHHFIPPRDVAAAWASSPAAAECDTEVVEMAPGDAWDSDAGFTLAGVDWYTDRDAHLDLLAAEVAPKLAEQAAIEAGRQLSFDTFRAYFRTFVRSLPPFSGRYAVKRPIVFHVPSSPTPFWSVDVRHRRVEQSAELPDGAADLIHIPEAVLADAIEHRIVHIVHGSMRIRTDLFAAGASDDLAFWGLMMVWELGYLTPRTLLRPRFVRALWRRRSEIFDSVDSLRGKGSFLERMSRNFSEPTDGPDAPTGDAPALDGVLSTASRPRGDRGDASTG
jgi:UDP-MurNAc hydroxylase